MKKVTQFLLSAFMVLSIGGAAAAVTTTQPVAAQVPVFQPCSGVNSEVCRGGGKLFGAGSVWNRILNTITFVAGAVAVLMIVIGGLRYTLSNGDQSGINNAKNTIIYAVVGLVLALMANAIVNFVLVNI